MVFIKLAPQKGARSHKKTVGASSAGFPILFLRIFVPLRGKFFWFSSRPMAGGFFRIHSHKKAQGVTKVTVGASSAGFPILF
jgi:hypothetical protein